MINRGKLAGRQNDSVLRRFQCVQNWSQLCLEIMNGSSLKVFKEKLEKNIFTDDEDGGFFLGRSVGYLPVSSFLHLMISDCNEGSSKSNSYLDF